MKWLLALLPLVAASPVELPGVSLGDAPPPGQVSIQRSLLAFQTLTRLGYHPRCHLWRNRMPSGHREQPDLVRQDHHDAHL